MKSHEVLDYKRNLKKLLYPTKLLEFGFKKSDKQTVEKIQFDGGIIALLGRNGAGKSSVLKHIEKLVHNRFDEFETLLIESQLKLKYHNQEVSICLSGGDYQAFSELSAFRKKFVFLNYSEMQPEITKLLSQPNAEDILDGLESVELSPSDLAEISFLVGNSYSKVEFCEIEDYSEDIGDTFPFFDVQTEDGSRYTTLEMGQGERILFHYWWKFKKGIENNSIVLIEEPEVFLFPGSQKALSHFLIKLSVDRKLNIVVSTHSNYFYREVNKRVLLQQRNAKIIPLEIPKFDQIDKLLDLELFPRNLIFVEDKSAERLFNGLFGKFDQSVLAVWQAYGAVVSYDQLKNMSMNFDLRRLNRKIIVGIDAKEFDEVFLPIASKNKNQFEIKSDSCIFNVKGISIIKIPGFINPDEDTRKVACDNFEDFCNLLELSTHEVSIFLNSLRVVNAHDWLEEAERVLGVSRTEIFMAGCNLLRGKDGVQIQLSNIRSFLEELSI